MILSLYSYLFSRNGNYYLYNSETKFFSQISESLYEKLYNKSFDEINEETLQSLIKKKILIKEEDIYSYYNKQKTRFTAQSYNQEALNLVIVPTTGCNFACPYCFEGEKHGKVMSDETVTRLISFINSHEKAKQLSLTWYGGEPLLAFKRMQVILAKIKAETSLQIRKQEIVTNGYLIDDEIIRFFKENQFTTIQITLDGTKEHHDQTRFLKNNHQPTFDVIVEKIKRVTEELPECKINVRVNINKKNADDFSAIHRMLHEMISSQNLRVYPGFIREETSDGCKLCYNCISDCNELYAFYNRLSQAGVDAGFKLEHANKGCMANQLNAYIVGPEGEMYKCWSDVNHPERIVGYIQDKKLTNETLFYNYLNETTPFANPECKDCLSFPICDGGCAWFHYKNKFENKHFNICNLTHEKVILENILLNMAKNITSRDK